MTRGSDIACALPTAHGTPALLAHESIVALTGMLCPVIPEWRGGDATLDVWSTLMCGGTVTLGQRYPAAA